MSANWTGTFSLANGFTAKLNANRELEVFGGGGGSADFIIDVTGYYL